MKKIAGVKIELVSIEDIRPNPENPRTISEQKIKELMKSIEDLPELLQERFIVVDRYTGYIIGGNQRWVACKRLGYEKVPVVYSDTMSEQEKKEFLIKDNMESGRWDKEKLNESFKDFPLYEWDILEGSAIAPEKREGDKADLEKAKETYDNADTKQIVIFLDSEAHKEVTKKLEEIKEKMYIDSNGGVLLYLLENHK